MGVKVGLQIELENLGRMDQIWRLHIFLLYFLFYFVN